MRALVIRDGDLSLVANIPEPVAGPDEAVIRPLLAGICNTDLELVRGYYDYQGVPGHEFVGEVVSGPGDWPGQRVVGEINLGCGACDFCRADVPEHCRARKVLGINDHPGVFAERFTLPVRNLYRVPAGITNEQAVFTEPLAAALQTLAMIHIRPSDRVIVLGAGKLGLLIAQVVRLTGADLAVVVRHDQQAELLGAWGIRAARFSDLPTAQADVVVDATGQAQGFADAQYLLRPRGTLVLKSTYHGLPEANLTAVAVQEVAVVGSRCGPFPAALRLLQAGLVDVEALITARYALAEGEQAFALAAQPGVLKVLLDFSA